MSGIDWVVLIGTLVFIVSYGVWKTRGAKNLEGYLKGDNTAKWWGIGISIMATQASAITFLSTPGQAYTDGMRFIQFYFGLPLAMIILSVFFLPIYYKLKVYTAYEYLESRFDRKTRTLAALLFLVQRGLAAGITIYAPAIILSTLLDWNLTYTNILIGFLVIIYTVSGGTKAVTQTQKQQMTVMMGGMILAGIMVIQLLPADISFGDAMHVAGKMDRLNIITTDFDFKDKYNIWSGMTAAVFLFMSYFGTDQSQVQRYLTGRSLSESRLGLMMNGLLKVPMQFVILFIGVMVFVFYQFERPPIFFNEQVKNEVRVDEACGAFFDNLESDYASLQVEKEATIRLMLDAIDAEDEIATAGYETQVEALQADGELMRMEAKTMIEEVNPLAETNDKDYIFMSFVMDYLPVGMIGLLFAVMFSAAMSSTASELNSLASTTTIDLYKRSIKPKASDEHYLGRSRLFTLLWGLLAILFATYASLFENLIQAVNILGSLFYGSILGIFVVAFFVKRVQSTAVFIGGLVSLACIFGIHMARHYGTAPDWMDIGYLWYNPLGCIIVVVVGLIIQAIIGKEQPRLIETES